MFSTDSPTLRLNLKSAVSCASCCLSSAASDSLDANMPCSCCSAAPRAAVVGRLTGRLEKAEASGVWPSSCTKQDVVIGGAVGGGSEDALGISQPFHEQAGPPHLEKPAEASNASCWRGKFSAGVQPRRPRRVHVLREAAVSFGGLGHSWGTAVETSAHNNHRILLPSYSTQCARIVQSSPSTSKRPSWSYFLFQISTIARSEPLHRPFTQSAPSRSTHIRLNTPAILPAMVATACASAAATTAVKTVNRVSSSRVASRASIFTGAQLRRTVSAAPARKANMQSVRALFGGGGSSAATSSSPIYDFKVKVSDLMTAWPLMLASGGLAGHHF